MDFKTVTIVTLIMLIIGCSSSKAKRGPEVSPVSAVSTVSKQSEDATSAEQKKLDLTGLCSGNNMEEGLFCLECKPRELKIYTCFPISSDFAFSRDCDVLQDKNEIRCETRDGAKTVLSLEKSISEDIYERYPKAKERYLSLINGVIIEEEKREDALRFFMFPYQYVKDMQSGAKPDDSIDNLLSSLKAFAIPDPEVRKAVKEKTTSRFREIRRDVLMGNYKTKDDLLWDLFEVALTALPENHPALEQFSANSPEKTERDVRSFIEYAFSDPAF